MSDIIDSIKEAYAEIAGVFIILDIISYLQTVVNLDNLFRSGQINIYEYLIRVILQLVIIPAIPSLVLGLIIHWIKEKIAK